MPAILLCGYGPGGPQLDARIKLAASVFFGLSPHKRVYYYSTDVDDTGRWRGYDVMERLQKHGLLNKHLYFKSAASNTYEEVNHFLHDATETDEFVVVSSSYHKLRLWRLFRLQGVCPTIHTTREAVGVSDLAREAASWVKLGIVNGLAH